MLTRHFDRKVEAQQWLDRQLAALLRGDHVAPSDAKMTVGEWCDKWLAGYGTRRASTVRQAEVHVKIIKAHFGSVPMSAVKPSGALGPFAISRRKLPNLHAASVRGFVGWARLDLLGQSGGEREHQALAQVIEWATLQVQFDLV